MDYVSNNMTIESESHGVKLNTLLAYEMRFEAMKKREGNREHA